VSSEVFQHHENSPEKNKQRFNPSSIDCSLRFLLQDPKVEGDITSYLTNQEYFLLPAILNFSSKHQPDSRLGT
jgi:hypothetical protein